MDLDRESNTVSDTDEIETKNKLCSEDEISGVSEKTNEQESPTSSLTITELDTGSRLARQNAGTEDVDFKASAPSRRRSPPLPLLTTRKDYLHDALWRVHQKHVFILTREGKPVYTLHGKKENLLSIFHIIHYLVNLADSCQDEIKSIEAQGRRYVFLVQPHLILAAISKTILSVEQLRMQLSDIYYQVLSIFTFCNTLKAIKRTRSYNLGRLLNGADTLIHCLATADCNDRINKNIFTFLTNSIQILPLQSSIRSSIEDIIKKTCKRLRFLLFVILIIDNQLITLIRKKKHSINSTDFRLIFNYVETLVLSEEGVETRPFCLPRHDTEGYMYAHASHLHKACPACLLFFSSERDDFYDLMAIKKSISKQLKNAEYFSAINGAVAKIKKPLLYPTAIGIPGLKHFLYKPTFLQQLLCAEFSKPCNTLEKFRYLQELYCKLFDRLHNKYCPLKFAYAANKSEITVGWISKEHELYAVFDSSLDQSTVKQYTNKIFKWIRQEFDTLFIYQYQTF
uniref:Vacuolar fusion protein MON1 homolog n=1 Tax=Glossina austeni TaxID=7395 RepID=A0A1A9UI64_GLOAU